MSSGFGGSGCRVVQLLQIPWAPQASTRTIPITTTARMILVDRGARLSLSFIPPVIQSRALASDAMRLPGIRKRQGAGSTVPTVLSEPLV